MEPLPEERHLDERRVMKKIIEEIKYGVAVSWFFISIIIPTFCLVLILLIGIGLAGDKEELSWKAKALISDFQLKQVQMQQANDALTAFLKEIEQKGFIYKDGLIVEKPKDVKKPEPPKK
jgi:hypothetical protein